MRRASQAGLTLPEVLIALLVFSAIAATGVYALRLGVDSRDQLATVDDDLKSFQIARTLIKQDLSQIALRPVRDEFGDISPAPFLGNLTTFAASRDDDEEVLASFVRQGWMNPGAEEPRSSLQFVEYVFRADALIRRTRAYVDEAPNADIIERVLFDGLFDVQAEFLLGEERGELNWVDAWPAPGAARLPRAFSLTLEREDGPPLEQFFWIGSVESQS